MSKGQTKKTREAAGNRRKLTRAEKKQIAEAIRKAKGDGKARTAQQTIPYLAMYPDGICKVTEKRYSKCVVFEDINYQLAQADDKTAIFENWCDFLNYFDASVSVQLSFINQGTQREQAEKAISIDNLLYWFHSFYNLSRITRSHSQSPFRYTLRVLLKSYHMFLYLLNLLVESASHITATLSLAH